MSTEPMSRRGVGGPDAMDVGGTPRAEDVRSEERPLAQRSLALDVRAILSELDSPLHEAVISAPQADNALLAAVRGSAIMRGRAEVLEAVRRCEAVLLQIDRDRVVAEEELRAIVEVIRAKGDAAVLHLMLESAHLRSQILEVELLIERRKATHGA